MSDKLDCQPCEGYGEYFNNLTGEEVFCIPCNGSGKVVNEVKTQ